MPDTWTTVTSTGSWDATSLTTPILLTEGGDPLRTESDAALTIEDLNTTWSAQSNSATTWATV